MPLQLELSKKVATKTPPWFSSSVHIYLENNWWQHFSARWEPFGSLGSFTWVMFSRPKCVAGNGECSAPAHMLANPQIYSNFASEMEGFLIFRLIWCSLVFNLQNDRQLLQERRKWALQTHFSSWELIWVAAVVWGMRLWFFCHCVTLVVKPPVTDNRGLAEASIIVLPPNTSAVLLPISLRFSANCSPTVRANWQPSFIVRWRIPLCQQFSHCAFDSIRVHNVIDMDEQVEFSEQAMCQRVGVASLHRTVTAAVLGISAFNL